MQTNLKITNDQESERCFYLEPWGERYCVPAKEHVLVVIESSEAPSIEWEFGSDADVLSIHMPLEVAAVVYKDGQVVTPA